MPFANIFHITTKNAITKASKTRSSPPAKKSDKSLARSSAGSDSVAYCDITIEMPRS